MKSHDDPLEYDIAYHVKCETEALELQGTPSIFGEDCKMFMRTEIYNDKVVPNILTCEDCGQFLQQ